MPLRVRRTHTRAGRVLVRQPTRRAPLYASRRTLALQRNRHEYLARRSYLGATPFTAFARRGQRGARLAARHSQSHGTRRIMRRSRRMIRQFGDMGL